jgi:hypothetical protein
MESPAERSVQAAVSSWWMLQALGAGLALVLLAPRRIRHLIIVVILHLDPARG